MTEDQRPEPLEPIPASEPPTDPAASTVDPPTVPPPTVEPPTVEAPAATAAAPAPPPPPAPPRRTHVTVPVWALAAVGGVLLLGLGFLLGWVLAPGDDDDSAANPAGATRELPFGGNFSPDGNGNGNGNGGGRFGFDEDTAYLGVVVQDSSDPDGAEIVRVAPDSPAEGAGLEDGDVVTEVDGDEVHDAAALTERIRNLDAGDRVSVKYERDGDERTVEVRLDERPSFSDLLPPTTRPRATS